MPPAELLNPALITLSISTLSPTAPASGEYIVIADLRGKDAFSSLAGRIVESYHDLETIEHLDQTPLPHSQVVTGIVTDLKEIIFPGYHRLRNLHWSNARDHVSELLRGLHERLRNKSRALFGMKRAAEC